MTADLSFSGSGPARAYTPDARKADGTRSAYTDRTIVELAPEGAHAKTADITTLQSALTAALATLATDADAQTIATKLEAIRVLLAGTLSVSAQALPLPGGAATASKQDTAATLLTAILAAFGPLATDADLTQGFASVVAKDEAIRALLAGTLQVAAQSLPLPNGAATDAKLEAVRALLAGTLAISAAALPLPAGAATDAKVEAVRSLLAGTLAISAAALPLPAGAATAAKQDTGNASLATIAGYEQPYANAATITPGTPVTAGRAVFIASTSTGSVRLKLSGGTTLDVPVTAAGPTLIDRLAVVDVVAANTTGTHVVSVLS
ncbi:hypothetical protein [Methylobacterium sp. J-070]|uniref:hypothetical protein n=1 Tax=Methylobacterium sp. J-070 TaxID=2836650 RepID=UPI001FBB7CDC|nr:hypothetical protein [Methylobacterium sp. J-070]MCJ2053978.1 hypothetical protein [Methylobacterium sp. J-070]